MPDENEELVTGVPTDIERSLGSSDLNETLGKALGFSSRTEATQGAVSVGDFDPASYVVDALGIMQVTPATDSSPNSDNGDQPVNPSQPQDSK